MSSLTLAEIAELCGAVLDGDPRQVVDGPAALAEAGPREISFLANPRYAPQLASTRAGAVLVAPGTARPRPDLGLLSCADPSRAFTAVVRAFAPADEPDLAGVHPTAAVHPEAEVDPSASIGPLCAVGRGARVGARAVLRAQVVVGAHAEVGAESVLEPGVVLYPRVRVGARCRLHGGTVIGSDGFGFDPTAEGWSKIPQHGTVVIEDEVEIGANCAVDRARFGATRIGRGAKLDNLVHIAHNVVVEAGALLIAQVGIAGSSRIGRGAVLAGQVGIAGHVTIGERARIGAQSGLSHDIPSGAEYFGSPARPRAEALRAWAASAKLPELVTRVRELERRLAALESGQAVQEGS
jgi:UDP-3-O-[3-hydroxymyristoyl] glucosamine N-acyltransferase